MTNLFTWHEYSRRLYVTLDVKPLYSWTASSDSKHTHTALLPVLRDCGKTPAKIKAFQSLAEQNVGWEVNNAQPNIIKLLNLTDRQIMYVVYLNGQEVVFAMHL